MDLVAGDHDERQHGADDDGVAKIGEKSGHG
jgi:hypothetical protein